jgi:tetratricopeptide (TPR) repeat protein
VSVDRYRTEVEAALAAVEDADATLVQKTEMLVEFAMALQKKPKSAAQLQAAVDLYRRALEVCPEDEPLLRARTLSRMATALRSLPGEDTAPLQEALSALEAARPVLQAQGLPEETGELEMNRGLVLQALSAGGGARIQDAIVAYQRALRVFGREHYPKEHAILHNNLATAFLSIAVAGEGSKMREALAVSSFEEGLKGVSLVDHPVEYAMLQNNLGNALQSISSSHALENGLRALLAYEEALRVRTRRDMPVEYANTIANKATCLWGLPDDPEDPRAGNAANLRAAHALLEEAEVIFAEFGEEMRAASVRQARMHLATEMKCGAASAAH